MRIRSTDTSPGGISGRGELDDDAIRSIKINRHVSVQWVITSIVVVSLWFAGILYHFDRELKNTVKRIELQVAISEFDRVSATELRAIVISRQQVIESITRDIAVMREKVDANEKATARFQRHLDSHPR